MNPRFLFKGFRSRCKELLCDYLLEYVSYLRILSKKDPLWIYLCNKGEMLIHDKIGIGVRCDWKPTSPLVATERMPFLGRALLKRAITDYPINIQRDSGYSPLSKSPEISFIIGHRGVERIENLFLTLESISAQKDARIECIVVEQDQKSHLSGRLPKWVRHIHLSPAVIYMPFCRSWVMNVGARHAKGDLLVFHDNDILVPALYSHYLSRIAGLGYDAINLKRFVFYLSKKHSSRLVESGKLAIDNSPEKIIQNLQGATTCFNRQKFLSIGGFDEEFVGWGYEDNELWDRAHVLNIYEYGFLPFIHLWHEEQPDKKLAVERENGTAKLYQKVSRELTKKRIEVLCARNFGNQNNMDPPYAGGII